MSTAAELLTLDIGFDGEPFCNVDTGLGADESLDVGFDGEPFVAAAVASGTVYARTGSVWKLSTPYVKVAGAWKAGRLYINVNGTWKPGVA